MIPLEHADQIGIAIIAAHGEVSGEEPEWWGEFQEAYKSLPRSG